MNVDHAKVIAACMALCGFAISIVAGIAVDNGFDVIISRALCSLAGCYVLGYLAGAAAQFAFSARVAELQQQQGEPPSRGGSVQS